MVMRVLHVVLSGFNWETFIRVTCTDISDCILLDNSLTDLLLLREDEDPHCLGHFPVAKTLMPAKLRACLRWEIVDLLRILKPDPLIDDKFVVHGLYQVGEDDLYSPGSSISISQNEHLPQNNPRLCLIGTSRKAKVYFNQVK